MAKIAVKCQACGGSGVAFDSLGEEQLCALCEGSGKLSLYELVLPPGVFASREIYEAIVHSEFASLTAAKKAYVNGLLENGEVDLNTGSRARAVLQEVFEGGTVTRDNLLALL